MGETDPSDSPTSVTLLLDEVRRGNPNAPGQLFTVVYDKLREVARGQRRRQATTETLNTTALVNEAFLKLFGSGNRDFKDRSHFMAVAATAMRQILIGHARRNVALKRGGGQVAASFEEIEAALGHEASIVPPPTDDALLALDRALDRLHTQSARQSRIVECRFFGGMSIEETAEALDISPATVKRDWSIAQAWLHREMQRELA